MTLADMQVKPSVNLSKSAARSAVMKQLPLAVTRHTRESSALTAHFGAGHETRGHSQPLHDAPAASPEPEITQ